jgi:hypothetical protein
MLEGSDKLYFELLALNTKGVSVIRSEINLLHSLLSNGTLWSSPTLHEKDKYISDGELKLAVKAMNQEEESNPSFGRAFLIHGEGPFSKLEPIRHPLVDHLAYQHLGPLYVLRDGASEYIACQLYPLLYRVENSLRGYLMKFMTTRLGPRWWEITAAGEWSQKIRQRKTNEAVFAAYIDNNAYLIDFGDLGRMIFAQSSGFTSKDDIIMKITGLEETPEAIRELKGQLQTNYHKFFKETFKDRGFQEKWEELEKLRHKVAHNNLFVKSDMEAGKKLCKELLDIINSASSAMESVVIAEEEKEAIRQGYVAQGYLDVITEEKYLAELAGEQTRLKGTDKFIGLSHFVKTHLGSLGYEYASSYDLTSRLEAQGKVETYKVDNPFGDFPTTAIKLVEDKLPTAGQQGSDSPITSTTTQL